MSWKSRLFRKLKTFSFVESLSKCTRKPPFYAQKPFFCTSLALCPQKFPISINQKLFFYTSPSILPSKATLFHHKRRPFAPSHNLLSAKNTAILLISALTPYAVTPEPRTDSKPFRRRLVRKTGFGSCRRKTLLKSSSIELWIAGRRTESRVLFMLLFARRKKWQLVLFAENIEVLQTSIQLAKTTTSH